MRKKRILIICFTFFILTMLVCAPATVLAISTDKAVARIDTAHPCSVTFNCKDPSGAPVAAVEIQLYHIATVSADFEFTVSPTLADSFIDINGIQSQSEWNSIMQTADAYIVANALTPAYTLISDDTGTATLSDVPQGVYYAILYGPDMSYYFTAYMLSLPALADDGNWVYNVETFPKTRTPEPPAGKEMKIVKQWKDGGEKRPDSVTVDIFCDGTFYETVALSSDSNWCYKWYSPTSHDWKAVERDVPKDYTVRIEKQADTIVITNVLYGDTPKTGDKEIGVLLAVFFVSGVMTVLLGLRLMRDKKYENK